MSRRLLLPPALLVVISGGVGALLVRAAIITIAPDRPRGVRMALTVGAAIVSMLVSGIAVRWLVGAPLRRVLQVVYRMTEGDFAVRTGPRGIGLTTEVLRALDDLAGRLEARCQAARVSEVRFRLLYENCPAGLFRTRLDGRVLDCNKAAVRMLGYDSVAEAKTYNARTFYADREDRGRLVERLRHDARVTSGSVDFRRKDGRVIPVLLTVHRTDGPDGPAFEGQFIVASGLGLEARAGGDNQALVRPILGPAMAVSRRRE